MIGLIGVDRPLGEKAAISFFGIRGLGSFYYLAYALGAAEFAEDRTLWVTVSLVVLISIVLHGASVTGSCAISTGRAGRTPRAPDLARPGTRRYMGAMKDPGPRKSYHHGNLREALARRRCA
jgi:hypothetical protein